MLYQGRHENFTSAFAAYWFGELSYSCGRGLITLGGAKDGFKNGKKKQKTI
jgi:hypothetical protein